MSIEFIFMVIGGILMVFVSFMSPLGCYFSLKEERGSIKKKKRELNIDDNRVVNINVTYMIEPLVVYQCSYCDDLSACGFNGQKYDESYDECHHPLLLEEARRMAASWNFCLNMDIEEIEKKQVSIKTEEI